jgi:hypothetical protein
MKIWLSVNEMMVLPGQTPPGFWTLFFGILFGLFVICIALSYCIARARWRTMMELRERHSPSRKDGYDDEWLHE